MTWNELIHQLTDSIPPERREEQALFLDRDSSEGFNIDSIEELRLDEVICYSNSGNDEDETTFVISM